MNFLKEVITDPDNRDIFVSPDIDHILPGATQYFSSQGRQLTAFDLSRLFELSDSVSHFESEGHNVAYSLLGAESASDEALILFAPFSDSEPQSHPCYAYMNTNDHRTRSEKKRSDSNSWNQITKSAVTQDILAATGNSMPVLTIFGPLPARAYDKNEREAFKRGDFRAAGRLALDVLAHAQERLHGKDAATQIKTLHVAGASLGASNGIGAANYIQQSQEAQVLSTTVQELIIGPEHLGNLGVGFSIKPMCGEPSTRTVPSSWLRFNEPTLRCLDKNGDPLATFGRMLKGASKLTFMKGLTYPETSYTPKAIEKLLLGKVTFLNVVAENSRLSQDTIDHLPLGFEDTVMVRAVEGKRAGHIINEHVALGSLMIAMNIHRARSARKHK